MENNLFLLFIKKFRKIVMENDMLASRITVKARILTPQEAIGQPTRKEFPLVKGEEKMIEAEFRGSYGQAFTDEPSNFEGTIEDVLNMEFNSNKSRAILVATVNAVLRHLGVIEKTRHCKNEEPEICGKKLVTYLKDNFNPKKVGIIGFQPAFVDHLSKHFALRVTDLNPKNIGKKKYGVLIESGNDATEDVIQWADVVLATGSCVVNGTLDKIMKYAQKYKKTVIFYGVTIGGAAYLLDLVRWCSMAHN